MADNSFGTLFNVTSFGESHGSAIGCVVDGVPPNLPLSEALIQPYLDRRRPGTSKFVTQRQEDDQVEILSGIFDGKTTGTPIGLLIRNKDQRSKDYGEIANQFRPGHADYTYQMKYGHRDYRGGGRSSARETAVRVAAGAIADMFLKKVLGSDYQIRGAVVQIGTGRRRDGAGLLRRDLNRERSSIEHVSKLFGFFLTKTAGNRDISVEDRSIDHRR